MQYFPLPDSIFLKVDDTISKQEVFFAIFFRNEFVLFSPHKYVFQERLNVSILPNPELYIREGCYFIMI